MEARDESWLRAKEAHDDAQLAAGEAEARAAEAKADFDRCIREVAEREAAERQANAAAETAAAAALRAEAWARMALELDRVAREQALRQAERTQKLRAEAEQHRQEAAAAAEQAREDANAAKDQAQSQINEAREARRIADDVWLRAKRDAAAADALAREQTGDASSGFYGVDMDTVDDDLKRQLLAAKEEYVAIQEPFGHG